MRSRSAISASATGAARAWPGGSAARPRASRVWRIGSLEDLAVRGWLASAHGGGSGLAGVARRKVAAGLDLFGEDQLVVAGVAQAVVLVAVADAQLALALQQAQAVDLGGGGGRAACGLVRRFGRGRRGGRVAQQHRGFLGKRER